ncbi:hypothetical protein D9M68_939670 [compost metagenome]
MRASPTICAERWFQSVMTSARTCEARVVNKALVSGTAKWAIKLRVFMVISFKWVERFSVW